MPIDIVLPRLNSYNFSLNRQKYIPEKVDSYFVINKYGKLMGLTEADLPKSL